MTDDELAQWNQQEPEHVQLSDTRRHSQRMAQKLTADAVVRAVKRHRSRILFKTNRSAHGA